MVRGQTFGGGGNFFGGNSPGSNHQGGNYPGGKFSSGAVVLEPNLLCAS